MKKLLILGGNGLHINLVKTAKKMGLYTIVTDYYDNSAGKELADEAWKIDTKDIDAIVEKSKEEGINGVISLYFDSCQRPYYEVCHRLNLPCYMENKNQLMALTDKIIFKKMCKENGVDTIPNYSEDDVENEKIEYPVIVKPNDSRGSYGVYKCNNKTELLEAIPKSKNESSDKKVLIEKYMGNCPDFSMTYFFANGEGHLIRTVDRYLGREEDNLNRQCIGAIIPSRNTNEFIKETNNKVIKMLKNIGVKNGPVFMQGFIDNGKFRFYDPGFRFSGSVYEGLLNKIFGVNLLENMIDFAISGEMKEFDDQLKNAYELKGKRCILVFPCCKPGDIAEINGLDKISNSKETFMVLTKHKVGDKIESTGDVKQRLMEITLLVDNDEKIIEKSVENVYNNLSVKDSNGNEMLISKFSLKNRKIN